MEKQKLPNGTAVIILGILSIVGCCCYGIPGVLLGIIAIVLANKDSKLYYDNPELYSNFSNIKTGKVLAYIGIVLSVLAIVFIIWVISIAGLDALGNEELMKQRIEEYFNR